MESGRELLTQDGWEVFSEEVSSEQRPERGSHMHMLARASQLDREVLSPWECAMYFVTSKDLCVARLE